jgi:DeoR family suf operon transcriptional repressor
MSVSRDNILAIIRRNDGANVDDLAAGVDLAPATIRRHLDILGRDGLVDHVEVRKRSGCPQHVFHLTEKGHDSVPKDYSRLLNELVIDIKNIPSEGLDGRSGDEVLRGSIARIGQKRAELFGRGRKPVEAVQAAFEDGGYDPIIETNDEGLTIRITNCPYRRASADDSIICTVDRTMIASLLGEGVEHQVSIVAQSNECVYWLDIDGLKKIDSVPADS